MTKIGFPFSGSIYYNLETGYKSGLDNTQPKNRFSDAVQNVRIDTGDINMPLRGIDSPNLKDFVKTMEDPTLHVEYIYQPHTGVSEISYFYTRSGCDLSSLAIDVGVSTCSSDDAFYHCIGCKAKNFSVSASKGDVYNVSVDFSVASMWVGNSAVLTDPGAIGTTYATFNNAGSITWTGVTGAYVTESFEFTVDNGLVDYHDVGSVVKKQAIPGARDVTGSCDISLDDGGKTQFNEILAGTDITQIKLNTGCTDGSYGEFQLNNGRFDSGSLDLNTANEGIITSVPFTFKTLGFASGS